MQRTRDAFRAMRRPGCLRIFRSAAKDANPEQQCLPVALLRSISSLAFMSACAAMLVALAACGADPTATLPTTQEQTAGTPVATRQPSATPRPVHTPTPSSMLPSTHAPQQKAPTEQPPPASAATRLPLPTPHPGNTLWVTQRLDAVVSLYRPTKAGEALLRSLDLRQMKGEPGFFGSYGFGKWAGVGEAKPVPTIHELGHSYWGGFPVTGRPDLGWERQDGEDIAPALASYHQDLKTFISQPPDDYEFLRERLRNLPGLSSENVEPLIHAMEADVPHITGGDLSLLPPLLRKYWDIFLSEGPFGSWERALGWFQSLPPEHRATAGKFLAFEHFDLRLYPGLAAHSLPDSLISNAADVLAVEERQRLTDFAEQFDLLIGDAQLEENFQFWRGYLQDKAALYRAHPDHLDSLDSPRATELSKALEFIVRLEGEPERKASILAMRLPLQPMLVNFLPAVDDQTLVELFAGGAELPQGPTLRATASFVERLQRFATLVEGVLAKGEQSPEEGAEALEGFLTETGFEHEQDLRLFFDLLRGFDADIARRIMQQMDKTTVQALMSPVPTQLRGIFQPEGLLEKLDITAEASDSDFRQGISLLVGDISGNYRIDEPFLERLYAVMAERTAVDPRNSLRVMAETPFPLEGMIIRQPEAASATMSSDISAAAMLITESDAILSPPARIVYRVTAADPSLAATIVIELDNQGKSALVRESLAYFAYDKVRSDKFPRLSISVANTGEFLQSLLARKGAGWLSARIREAVELYRQRADSGEVAADFLHQYRQTLEAAAASRDAETASRLAGIIHTAFN